MKARILLKADVRKPAKDGETTKSLRKQLVEEGLEAVLSRKPRAVPAIPSIFDGEKEAKLITTAPDDVLAQIKGELRGPVRGYTHMTRAGAAD